jgi:pyochelin synthetase
MTPEDLMAEISAPLSDTWPRHAGAPVERLQDRQELRGGDSSFPLTEMQQAYLVGRSSDFELGGISSYVYHEIETTGLDTPALAAALHRVIRKHPALRIRIGTDGRQSVLAPEAVPAKVREYDLRQASAAESSALAAAVRAEMSHQVMALDAPPFLDVRLAHLGEARQLLFVGHDGLTMDGMSMQLFFREWFDAYHDPDWRSVEPAVTFADYVRAAAERERSASYQNARGYWQKRIDRGLPAHPQLPLRRDPESLVGPRLTRHEIELPATQYRAFLAQADAIGLTPTAALLAAYCEVLAAWGGGAHFSLSLSFANRLPIHPDINQVIGNFTSILLLEIDARGAQSFAARASAIQRQLRQDLDYRLFSGLQVQRELRRRANGAAVRLPITFNSALEHGAAPSAASPIERFGTEVFGTSQTPQVWLNTFVLERRGGAVVQLDAVEELFPEGMVRDMAAAYRSLIERLSTDATQWQRCSFALLPPAQALRRQQANSTNVPVPARLLQDSFVAAARRQPQAVAIRTSQRTMTYAELHRASGAVAQSLRLRGIRRDQPVGIVMRKGWEQLVAILGSLIAGAPYVVIDAALPAARICFLIRDADVRQVLTTSSTDGAAGLERAACHTLYVDHLDEAASPGDGGGAGAATPEDMAYLIYTSGTTGRPKGVMVSHRSAQNLIADTNRRFAIGERDAVFALSNAGFDLSVYDIFGTLAAGGTIVIPDADKVADPAHWLSLAEKGGVTLWNSVPAAARMLVEHCEATRQPLPSTLRLMLLSGDHIPPSLPPAVRRLHPDVALHSLGGPTETTVWNIAYPIAAAENPPAPIPYGKPTSNNRYYVLDDRLEECPDWVSGVLYAAGAGLAIGYWKDEQRSAADFFCHHGLRERLYRTGDVGRYLADGNIEILGRSDAQLKIRGYRIEPAEIEAQVAAHAAVRGCAVVADEADSLVAHVVAAVAPCQRAVVEREIRERLSAHLPLYMTPGRFVWTERLPLTVNGKVDRKQLAGAKAEDEQAPAAEPESAALTGEVEQRLAKLWCQILKRDSVSATQNFLEIGGDSIAAARLALALRKEFGVSAPLSEVMRQQTIRALGAYVEPRRRR